MSRPSGNPDQPLRSAVTGLGVVVAAAMHLLGPSPAIGQPVFDFSRAQNVQFGFEVYPTCVGAGDLDRDGRVDLVVTGRNLEGKMLVLLGDAGGGFQAPAEIEFGGPTEWVIVRDLDRDGFLDLAVTARVPPDLLSVMRGNGDGTFAPREDYATGRSPIGLTTADFDRDGDLDLAVANNNSDSCQTFINAGDGTFELDQTILLTFGLPVNARSVFVCSTDLDNDDDVDIVATHLATGNTSIILNEGGRFALPTHIPIGAPAGVTTADANGDGAADLLIADLTNFEGSLTVFENDGAAGFTGPSVFPVPGWTWFVATADLDGDGPPDAVVTDAQFGKFNLLPNLGGPQIAFGAIEPYDLGVFPRFVLPLDVDDDCDFDLVMIDIGEHTLSWWRNDTPQGGCAVADLNGDGRVDVLDLLELLLQWGSGAPRPDFNHDGIVNVLDLLFLLERWG